MSNKFLFIVAIFLLLVPVIVSTGSNSYNAAIEIKTGDDPSLASPKNQQANTIQWNIELPNNSRLTIKLGRTSNKLSNPATAKISNN
jgi:predicted PurR-regulated permease PerM